jgi:iron complex outermembrane receptor protein
MVRKLVALSLSSAALAFPLAAAAQDADESRGIEEIIVTAQRREQSLIDVPLSIAAATNENLAAKGLNSVTDLRFETPGFISQSGTGYTQIYIRGIGNGIFVGADPSVATFIDDVPRVYGSLVDSFINIDRVEVLKGAQGGLYGRNATGGVINIVTMKPDDEVWKLKGRISVGEFQTVDASAFVNIPITSGVAMTLSGQRKVHDPYQRNLATHNPYPPGTRAFGGAIDPNNFVNPTKTNYQDFYALDAKLRFEPTDTLAITLAADYSDKHDADGNGWVNVDPNQYFIYRAFGAVGGLTNFIPDWRRPKFGEEVYNGLESFSYTEDYGFSGTIDLSLEGIDLKSISALRYNNSNFRGDVGAMPVPLAGFFTDFDRKFVYQELRAVSNGTGPLRFVAGASYFHDNIDNQLDGLFLGFQTSRTIAFTKTTNWSVYGELTYDVTDALTITGSLRYVTEKKNARFPVGGGAAGGQGEEFSRTKQSKLLPSVNISYDIGDGVIYARYARGFKTGGINPIVRPSAFKGQPGSTFKPEVVDAFEVGYRAYLFDNRVQLTAAAFYNKYNGVHVVRAGNAANPTLSNGVFSLDKARTYGAEASVVWQVVPSLTISGHIGYLNAKYQDAAYPGSPVVDPFDASGNRMALAPKWQGGVSVVFDQPVNDALRIKASALFSHISTYNYQYEEAPTLQQPGYEILNLRAGIATIEDNVGLYIFANNVTDKKYSIFGSKGSTGTYLTPGAPRVIGGTLEFDF